MKNKPCPRRARVATRTSTTRHHLVAEAGKQGIHGHRPQILTAAGTHGHLHSLHLLVADDQLVRQLLQAMFSNFIGYFLVTQIRSDAQAGRPEPRLDLPGIVRLPVRNVEDDRLDGGKPEWQGAGVVFDQNADNRSSEPTIARCSITGTLRVSS